MANRERFSIKGEESMCTKRWEVEGKDNPVIIWCIDS